MAHSPEGYNSPQPSPQTEGVIALENFLLNETEVFEDSQNCITPEGYDVSTVEGATAYLTEFHGRILPVPGGDVDRRTNYHLGLALKKENRAALDENLENQNVAEHTLLLEISATSVAAKERPDLDYHKVGTLARIHDQLEAYCGDTIITDPEAMEYKPWKEKAAMTLLKQDYAGTPIIDDLEEYEKCETAEARFVNAMDKVEAYQFALNNKAALHLIRDEDFTKLVQAALPKAFIDPTAFDLMKKVFKEIGRKWNDWCDISINGDPTVIINELNQQLEDRHARLRTAVAEAALRQAEESDSHVVGNIYFIDKWLARKYPPTPPSPSPVSAAIVL